VVAAGTTLLFFLQLRIADEFKDFDDDVRYRSYRPVPRGLVSLGELGFLGGAGAAVQLALALLLRPALALLLGLVWLYLAVMTMEFFAAHRLKAHPLVYVLSHMVIIPLVNLYATACDWLAAGEDPPLGLIWFLAASYFTGLALELGRKIRAPLDEEPGVETYSSAWGVKKAVLAWLAALALSGLAAAIAARQVGFLAPTAALLAVMLAVAAGTAWLFLRDPSTKASRRMEAESGAWTLLVYLGMGILPALWHWAFPSGATGP
jgi:4-hydroxybenzoate polyprenyltransferase